MRWLSGDEARQREPLVSSDVRAAIYTPEASHLAAPPWDTVKSRSSTRLLRSPGSSKALSFLSHDSYGTLSGRSKREEEQHDETSLDRNLCSLSWGV